MKEYTSNTRIKTVFILFSGFMWFFTTFLMFISSMEKFNSVIIPTQTFNTTNIEELSILSSKLFFSYAYLKSFLDIGKWLVAISLATTITVASLKQTYKKVEWFLWLSLIINLLFFGYMNYTNFQLGNITITGSSVAMYPGLVDSHISYPIPSLLLSAEAYLVYILVAISLITIYEKDIISFLKKIRSTLVK